MSLIKTAQQWLKGWYSWLRSRGFGERTLKTALAVTLAWVLGKFVPGSTDHPYFAPLTALVSMQTTVADSVTGAVQRVLGIIAGVALALLISSQVGESAWGIGLVVLVALLVGTNLHLSSQGVSEVAVSALLVLFFGNANDLEYAGNRLVECSVGAVVGVGVNALLAPPNHLGQARAAAQALSLAIISELDNLALVVRNGLNQMQVYKNLAQARSMSVPLAEAQSALEQAEVSLKYNLLSRTQQAQLEKYRHFIETLEHSVIQVRGMARALYDMVSQEEDTGLNLTIPTQLNEALDKLFSALSMAVSDFSEGLENIVEGSREFRPILFEIEQCRQAVYQTAAQRNPPLNPKGWMQLGALLGDADRLQSDLELASARKESI